jgi:hypothetical protein
MQQHGRQRQCSRKLHMQHGLLCRPCPYVLSACVREIELMMWFIKLYPYSCLTACVTLNFEWCISHNKYIGDEKMGATQCRLWTPPYVGLHYQSHVHCLVR